MYITSEQDSEENCRMELRIRGEKEMIKFLTVKDDLVHAVLKN